LVFPLFRNIIHRTVSARIPTSPNAIQMPNRPSKPNPRVSPAAVANEQSPSRLEPVPSIAEVPFSQRATIAFRVEGKVTATKYLLGNAGQSSSDIADLLGRLEAQDAIGLGVELLTGKNNML
jgi:hypothetical protein